MGATIAPDSDNVSSLLSYFNSTSRDPVPVGVPALLDLRRRRWAPYGDVSASATDRREVGGRRPGRTRPSARSRRTLSKYTVIAGSGFLPRSLGTRRQPRRRRRPARSLYLLTPRTAPSSTARTPRRQRRPGRDRRQLRVGRLRLHEDEERAAGRPGRDRARRDSRFIDQDLHRRPRRQRLALRHRPGRQQQPAFPSAPIKLATLGRRPADLRLDGHRGRRHASSTCSSAPAATCCRRPASEHDLQAGRACSTTAAAAARRSSTRWPRWTAAATTRSSARFRRSPATSSSSRRRRYKPQNAVRDARRQPLRAHVCRQRRLRQRRRQQHTVSSSESPQGEDAGGRRPRDGALHRRPAPGLRRRQQHPDVRRPERLQQRRRTRRRAHPLVAGYAVTRAVAVVRRLRREEPARLARVPAVSPRPARDGAAQSPSRRRCVGSGRRRRGRRWSSPRSRWRAVGAAGAVGGRRRSRRPPVASDEAASGTAARRRRRPVRSGARRR